MKNELSTIMSEAAVKPTAPSTDEMRQLSRQANQAHAQVRGAARKTVKAAVAAGRALLEARRLCPPGTWESWLQTNFQGSSRTARGYMRLATFYYQLGGDRQRAAGLSQREAERIIAGFGVSHRASRGQTEEKTKKSRALAAPASNESRPRPDESLAMVSGDSLPAASDPFALVADLLARLVAELQRLMKAGAGELGYAHHLLQRIKPLYDGLGAREWVWDD